MSSKGPSKGDLTAAAQELTKSCKCMKCGRVYDKQKGNFPASNCPHYSGFGYIPICNECLVKMYESYLAQCGVVKDAIRQMCRKLDLYYSDAFESTSRSIGGDRSPWIKYLVRIKTCDKTYDDTLEDDGTKWEFREPIAPLMPEEPDEDEVEEEEEVVEEIFPDEWLDAWGEGLTRKEYEWLEKRYYHYWNQMSEEDRSDIGNEPLIRQICNLEFDIRACKGTGKSIEKNVNTLNSLVKSMNWTPNQTKTDDTSAYDKTPFGVWIRRFEDSRPIPEPDEDFADPDNVKKFIHVYFLGHLCHMMGIHNEYDRMYIEEMEKYSVKPPEFSDDETNELYSEIFGESN